MFAPRITQPSHYPSPGSLANIVCLPRLPKSSHSCLSQSVARDDMKMFATRLTFSLFILQINFYSLKIFEKVENFDSGEVRWVVGGGGVSEIINNEQPWNAFHSAAFLVKKKNARAPNQLSQLEIQIHVTSVVSLHLFLFAYIFMYLDTRQLNTFCHFSSLPSHHFFPSSALCRISFFAFPIHPRKPFPPPHLTYNASQAFGTGDDRKQNKSNAHNLYAREMIIDCRKFFLPPRRVQDGEKGQ